MEGELGSVIDDMLDIAGSSSGKRPDRSSIIGEGIRSTAGHRGGDKIIIKIAIVCVHYFCPTGNIRRLQESGI